MKKNAQLALRISDQDRHSLNEHAEHAGVTTSDLVRAMIARETATGEIARGMKPRATKDRAWEIHLTDLIGREWTIRWQTDGIRPFRFSWIGGVYCEEGYYRPHLTTRDVSELPADLANEMAFPKEHLTATLQKLRNACGESFEWDDPEYREICRGFGFNPDMNRPLFAKRDQQAADLLLSIITQNKADKTSMAAREMWNILRKDIPTSLYDWANVMEREGLYFQARVQHPGLRRVGRRLKPPRLKDLRACKNTGYIRLLPSQYGNGCLGTVCFGLAQDIKGVAVIPEKMDKLHNRALVKFCTNPELIWLAADEVGNYQRRIGWIWRQKHGRPSLRGRMALFLDRFLRPLGRRSIS